MFQKKAKGEELFDQIMYHLDIVEKDYFGLRFMDSAQVPVSVEMHFTQLSFYFIHFASLCLCVYLLFFTSCSVMCTVFVVNFETHYIKPFATIVEKY